MASGILVFLLFFLSLLVVPFGYAWFEPPKVICAQILIEILLAATLIKSKNSVLKSISADLLVPILLFFALTVIDLIFFRTQTTLLGNIFRLQGIFLFWHLLLLALISSRVKFPKIPNYIYLISLFGLLTSAFLLGKNDSGRSLGTLGEPNALAASVIFLLPFLFYSHLRKIARFFCLFVALWIVLLSGSRAGLIAFVIQIVFFVLASKFALKKTAIICLMLFAVSLSFPLLESGGVYENRAEIWQAAAAAGTLNPILGGGFGNLETLIPKGSELVHNNARFQYVDSSHNFILDYWVAGGIFGLGSILFLLFKAIKNFIAGKKKLELAAFLGLIIALSFNPASVVTLVEFWWLIGQGN